MSKAETTLRTQMSLWLETTDALIERLVTSEASQQDIHAILLSLRRGQHAVSLLFAHKSQFTPEKYAKLAGALAATER